MWAAPWELMELYTDGASRGNPGEAGGGVVLLDGEKEDHKAIYFGRKTNNQAEYMALLEGLRMALERGARQLEIHMDSQLIVRQLQGKYKVKSKKLKPLHSEAITLLGRLDKWSVRHVDRENNKKADRLANHAIDAHI